MTRARSLLLVPVLAAFGVAGVAAAAGVDVHLTATGPQPATVTIAPGDTVTFANDTALAHEIDGRRAGLSVTLPPGGSASHAFPTAGKYSYWDRAGTKVRGVIVVSGGTGTGTTHTGGKRHQVAGAAGTVALSAGHPSLVWGNRIVLSGHASPNAVVTLTRHARGQESWAYPRQLTATASGAFSVQVQPAETTMYRVQVGKAVSKALTITVLPRITLGLSARRARSGTVVVAPVRVQPPAATRLVDLKAQLPGKKSWARLQTRIIDRKTGRVSFHFTLQPGRTVVRAFISSQHVAAGYEGASSPQLTVTGVGPAPAKH